MKRLSLCARIIRGAHQSGWERAEESPRLLRTVRRPILAGRCQLAGFAIRVNALR